VPEIDLAALGPLHLGTVSKTRFSMLTPQLIDIARLNSQAAGETSIVLFGIEVRRLHSAIAILHIKLTSSHTSACCKPPSSF
jgi:hypothetical protein